MRVAIGPYRSSSRPLGLFSGLRCTARISALMSATERTVHIDEEWVVHPGRSECAVLHRSVPGRLAGDGDRLGGVAIQLLEVILVHDDSPTQHDVHNGNLADHLCR